MGKWSFLKGKVAAIDKAGDDPTYADALAGVRTEYEGKTFEQLSDALSAARDEKENLEQKLRDANLRVTVIERVVLERLDQAGLDSIVAGGYRLTPSPEPVFQKKDEAALRQWALETGQEDLLTINSQTLTSLSKTHYLEHNETPPGVELAGFHTKLSRTKSK